MYSAILLFLGGFYLLADLPQLVDSKSSMSAGVKLRILACIILIVLAFLRLTQIG